MMSAINRLCAVALTLVLAVTTLAKPSPSVAHAGAPSPEPDGISDTQIIEEIANWTTQWLSKLQNVAPQPLACPHQVDGSFIEIDSDGADACLWTVDNKNVYLRVQNRTNVPATVHFASTWYTINPMQTNDYLLQGARYHQTVTMKRSLPAAVVHGLFDYAGEGRQVMHLRPCEDGLSAGCLVEMLAKFLPKQVKVGNIKIPARRIASLASKVWEYRPVIGRFQRQVEGAADTTLTFRHVCDTKDFC